MKGEKEMRSDERLGSEKMTPLVFKMALPSVAAQLVNLLYNLVDRMYIGKIEGVGTDALAGVGLSSSVILLIAAFASLVGGGGSPQAAIALGKGDREGAARILNNGFVMLLFFSALCTALPLIFLKPILLFAGASDVTLPYAAEYLSVYLCGTVFVMLASGLNMFISCQGRPGIAMASVVIGAGLNVLLDPLFIFTFGMGVRGAALATVISQAVSAAWVLFFLFSRRANLKLDPRLMRPRMSVIMKISALGISPFVMASTESLVGFALNGQLSQYGGDIHVSALAIMQGAMQMVSVPLSGFAQGVIPILSYNFGHKRGDRVRACFRTSALVVFLFNLFGILFMILFPRVIAGMFTADGELIEVVARYMPVFLLGMTIFGLQRMCQNTFVALGQAKVSLFIALLRKVILLVPLSYLLPLMWQVQGVYIAEAAADAIAAVTCATLFTLLFPRILGKNEESINKSE